MEFHLEQIELRPVKVKVKSGGVFENLKFRSEGKRYISIRMLSAWLGGCG